MRAIAMGLLLTLAGCQGAPVVDIPNNTVVDIPNNIVPAMTDKDPAPVIAANTAFALDLYAKLRTREGNLFFSPYSISTGVAMTYAGARGETAAQMAAVAHFPSPQDSVPPMFASLAARVLARSMWEAQMDNLENASRGRWKKPEFVLRNANALWGKKDYTFIEGFLDIERRYYGAPLNSLDFVGATESARKTINAWVAQQTDNRIADLVPQGVIDQETRLVLINALYFKGAWVTPFNARATQREPFHVSSEKTVTAQVMSMRLCPAKYCEIENLQCLELGYKSPGLTMVVVLPRTVDGLGTLEVSLSPEKLKGWLSALKEMEPDVYLPKFSISANVDLKPMLIEMGMPLAFDPGRADFSGMTQEQVWVDVALHNAVVEVDERGTTAAAATMVELAAAAPPEQIIFRADHPFLFLIRDTRTGTILFLGRLTNPV